MNETIHKVNEEVLVADVVALERIYFRVAELLLAPSGAPDSSLPQR